MRSLETKGALAARGSCLVGSKAPFTASPTHLGHADSLSQQAAAEGCVTPLGLLELQDHALQHYGRHHGRCFRQLSGQLPVPIKRLGLAVLQTFGGGRVAKTEELRHLLAEI